MSKFYLTKKVIAKSAMDSGVAKFPIADMNDYRKWLDRRLSEHITKYNPLCGILIRSQV